VKKGWEIKKIADVCEVIAGQSPEGKYYNNDGKGIPFYQGKKEFGDKFIDSPTTWTTQTTKIARDGDILMSVRAPVGPVNFATEEICIGRGLAAIRSGSKVNRDFLFYQLLYIQPDIAGKEGAVFASINKSEIEALPLFYVPLPEQRRIVGILNEAFDAIAKAKANAEKNLQNARELFESHLNEVFTKRGEGWVEKRLGDIAESISTGPFGTMLHKSDYVDDGIPLVNPMNIIESKIIPSSKMMVNETTRNRLLVYTLKRGDVVIARRGELGRCAVVTEREEGWLCGTGSFFVRLKETMSGEYFVTLFSSKPVRERLEESSVGTTMSNLNHGILNELILPLPPLKEQHKIMSTVHKLLFETQHLESIYKRKLTALEELKKSLLHQAFNGEFTRDN